MFFNVDDRGHRRQPVHARRLRLRDHQEPQDRRVGELRRRRRVHRRRLRQGQQAEGAGAEFETIHFRRNL
jgi:hypothetical protein